MKIKIINNLSYQTFPITDDMVEVNDKILEQIGVTKQFDVFNCKVIDYDNSKEIKISRNHNRISELKELLNDSDYHAIKFAEGLISEEEYKPIKELRQSYRAEINQLEEETEEILKKN